MIHALDEMCERTVYTEYIRTLNENDRPTTITDKCRRLRIMHRRFSEPCQIIYRNSHNCRKPRFEGQCRYAVGPSEVTYLRSEMRTDPWPNEAKLPQGQICLISNVTKRQLLGEIVNSVAIKLYMIKATPTLRYAVKRRLRTFRKALQARWQNLADAMNNDLAQLEQSMGEMRAQAIQISHKESLLARYAARRAVTGTGNQHRELRRLYAETQQDIHNNYAMLREKELLIGDRGNAAQSSMVSYYLHQRIQLMLPHLHKLGGLEKNYVYEVTIKKGEIKIRNIVQYGEKIEPVKPTTYPPTTRKVKTTHGDIESKTTKLSRTKISTKTSRRTLITTTVPINKERTTMNSFGNPKTLMNNRTWQQIMRMPKFKMDHELVKEIEQELEVKNKTQKNNETLIFVLIITGTILGATTVMLLGYKMCIRNKIITAKEAKAVLDKTKNIAFTGTRK